MTETAHRRRRRTRVPLVLPTVALLAAASCGGDDDATTTDATAASIAAPDVTASSKPVATTTPTTAPPPPTPVATTAPSTTAPPPTPATTVAPVASAVPAAPAAQPVIIDGWCSQALVDFMIDQSTASTFVPGFAVPDIDSGLDVGCSGTSPEPSFPGYIDTFTVVRNDPGVIDALADRIRAAGYLDDSLADPAHPMFQSTAGDPIAFVTPLDLKAANGGTDLVFQDASQWVVVQFYLPG